MGWRLPLKREPSRDMRFEDSHPEGCLLISEKMNPVSTRLATSNILFREVFFKHSFVIPHMLETPSVELGVTWFASEELSEDIAGEGPRVIPGFPRPSHFGFDVAR